MSFKKTYFNTAWVGYWQHKVACHHWEGPTCPTCTLNSLLSPHTLSKKPPSLRPCQSATRYTAARRYQSHKSAVFTAGRTSLARGREGIFKEITSGDLSFLHLLLPNECRSRCIGSCTTTRQAGACKKGWAEKWAPCCENFSGRSVKQHQEQNSPNLGSNF